MGEKFPYSDPFYNLLSTVSRMRTGCLLSFPLGFSSSTKSDAWGTWYNIDLGLCLPGSEFQIFKPWGVESWASYLASSIILISSFVNGQKNSNYSIVLLWVKNGLIHINDSSQQLPYRLWSVSQVALCPLKIYVSPNPQYLWGWPYGERGSLQMFRILQTILNLEWTRCPLTSVLRRERKESWRTET